MADMQKKYKPITLSLSPKVVKAIQANAVDKFAGNASAYVAHCVEMAQRCGACGFFAQTMYDVRKQAQDSNKAR